MLVIFSGSSGVGKNTVINELLSRHKDMTLMPTYTTRDMRPGEKEGKPYYFVSQSEFMKMLAENAFLEHEQVHGHYYGTPRKALEESARGKTLLKDIDVKGTKNLLKRVKGVKICAVFFTVESKEILRKRLLGRGETQIELRLKRYEEEQNETEWYDYIIDNIDLQQTTRLMEDIIAFEKRGGILSCGREYVYSENAKAAVEKYAAMYRNSGYLPPIDVTERNGEFFILDGHERYLASIKAEGRIAKTIRYDKKTQQVNQTDWLDHIKGL